MILEIIGLSIVYLCIGYSIGKISNREYLNNTPTENLSLPSRLKRFFLKEDTVARLTHDLFDQASIAIQKCQEIEKEISSLS